ncbi:40S ribosomal protein S3, putative, partial [Trypanosoma cruzi]
VAFAAVVFTVESLHFIYLSCVYMYMILTAEIPFDFTSLCHCLACKHTYREREGRK